MTYPKDNSLFGLSSSGSVCIWTYWDMCIHIFKYQYNRKHARVLPCILLHKLHSGILPQSNSFIATSLPSSLPRCFLVETRFFTARFQGAPQILVSKPPFWLPAQACRQSLGVTGVLRPQIHVVLLGARKMLPEWGPLRFFFHGMRLEFAQKEKPFSEKFQDPKLYYQLGKQAVSAVS